MTTLLTAIQVGEICGVGPMAIRRWTAAGNFPAAVRLGVPGKRGPVRWKSNDVQAWIDNREPITNFAISDAAYGAPVNAETT